MVGLLPSDYLVINQNGLNTGVDISVGDSSKAQEMIKWDPKVTWRKIAEKMLDHDLARVRADNLQ
jgi:GDP-D-mannose dehydratase